MAEKSESYFLSYSRQDQEFARKLARDLADAGKSVFFDQDSIPPGVDWTAAIQAALDGCSCLLILLSPHSIASRNVLDETRFALDNNKRVVPILMSECKIPFWIHRIEHVDFTGTYQDAFGRLVREIAREPARILAVENMKVEEELRAASSRNIIVCFDHQQLPTFQFLGNAFKLARMAESVSNRQIVYYDPGVEMLGGAGRGLRQVLQMNMRILLGRGFLNHVEHAYSFLMDNYRPGDRLFLIGSSAGGLIANALANVLETFGLLNKASAVVIPYVVRGQNNVSEREARDFREALSFDCYPHFLGMWDCVQIFGVFQQKAKSQSLSAHTPFGYHALSIDEQRKWFRPFLWAEPGTDGQTIEQVWFAGVHADVCGGYLESGLSDISLRWMVEKAAGCGMLFIAEEYERLSLNPVEVMHNSRLGTFRFLGKRIRQIPAGSRIHPSVLTRLQANVGYAPKNLPN
jgi:hypothetical protein